MKISIVTPCLNPGRFLAPAMRSILDQAGPFDLEWIVMDAGSTDGTLERLRALDDPRVILSSGPDSGQAQAINNGLAKARGDVLAWLNADDCYAPGALTEVVDIFQREPRSRWIIGRCRIIDAAGREIRRRITRYKERGLFRFTHRRLLRENFISQPAVFWRRELWQQAGPLDEALDYTMDYDLWLRMSRIVPPRLCDRVLAEFRLHPTSKSGRVRREQFDEQYRVARRYLGDDVASRLIHRLNVEKIVWSYRLMRCLGR